ncbi:MAG: hypothetical protein ABW092_20485 [Candidatus Thiodiazotropha sp.]
MRSLPSLVVTWVICLLSAQMVSAAPAPQVTVVNMIPASFGNETNQDSEPNLAVNPNNPMQIAGSAFTSGAGICPSDLAPIYVSSDEGASWELNCIVPSDASGMTSDITVRFAKEGDNLYAGILRRPGSLRLNILSTSDFMGASTMTVLEDRNQIDQPYIQATTVGGNDQVFVGVNDFAAGSKTATVEQSLDAAIPAPSFTSVRVEARATSGQDGPPIRPTIHPDGTVYAMFYGWRNFSGGNAISDVTVVRDDNSGAGPTPFTDLTDPGDGLNGRRVVTDITVPWANFVQNDFCQERFVGSNLSIATDPNNSDIVYIAWAERVGSDDYTLRVRRSNDRGQTWSGDLRTITNATNPALAINEDGLVGFLYQECVTTEPGQLRNARWVTHLEFTEDQFSTTEDLILANVPADNPSPTFIPYIGDYVHLMTIGRDFYGIFSANNTPDLANFPNGVTYQRDADFTTKVLFNPEGKKVVPSIDPFFVKVSPPRKKETVYKYAAKLVCGIQDDPADMRLARGFYATTINIHNPNEKKVKFKKSLSLTYPPPKQRPGKVIPIAEDRLGPDQALAVDCIDIRQRLFPSGFPRPYIEGFVTLVAQKSLDVTAVYTSRALDQRVCCEPQGKCGGKRKVCHGHNKCGVKDHSCCQDKKHDCPSCCYTLEGNHSSIDVEQIAERIIKRIPPDDKKPDLPDLVPTEAFDPPPLDNPLHLPQRFCLLPDDGLLPAEDIRVIVRNQGDGAADQSITEVKFSNPIQGPVATSSQITDPLASGAEVALDFTLPDGCYIGGGQSCKFEIRVNAGAPGIKETTEANNTTSGSCPGVVP